VPSRGDDEEFRLDYIGVNIMPTPEISILEARREIAKFGKLTGKMSTMIQQLIVKKKIKKRAKLMDKVRRYEENTDRMEVEIANFLIKAAEGNLSKISSANIRGLLSINNDLERIADIFYQMSKSIERKNESDLWFTEQQTSNLLEMLHVVDRALEIMNMNLDSDYAKVKLGQAVKIEEDIDAFRDKLRRAHLISIEQGDYHIQSSLIYNELFYSCEKVGDHVINVTEAIVGKI
ncbi:MAG: Na/Pi cotransporter family protein, partial [Bacteroidetes bacterium]|nr:Na/Pi cotransporter family protein [Bacteroidota bacterium]